MDVIFTPQALLGFYGFLVLASGGVLGFIAARKTELFRKSPTQPNLLERRTETLENELEAAQAELSQLREEAQFLRGLLSPEKPTQEPRE